MNQIMAVLSFLLIATPAFGIDCATKRGHDGRHWAWRLVDSKVCWYAGPRGVPKFHFRWPSDKERRDAAPTLSERNGRVPTQIQQIPQIAQDPDPDGVWPPLPDSFDARFLGEPMTRKQREDQ